MLTLRRTRFEDARMEILSVETQKQIHKKVYVFATNDKQIPSSICGLIANKLMEKYQRSVCVGKNQLMDLKPDLLKVIRRLVLTTL